MRLDPRGVFCNRTLNLKSIRAIGYDMDYTLVHYHIDGWERRAYDGLRAALSESGLPVSGFEFDGEAVARGLILDLELGNVVKANRFGYVKAARHGTRELGFDAQRRAYARTIIDLRERRWVFLNTLFAISGGCMWLQLVDALDRGDIAATMAEEGAYQGLHRKVSAGLDRLHTDGRMKAEIGANPEPVVDLDPKIALTLLDQKHAGKTLLLITNSEWSYTQSMMRYAIDPFLPEGMTFRDLFDYIFVSARKPQFFNHEMPVFALADDSGLFRDHAGPVEKGGVYVGGSAALIERSLKLTGSDFLYVGDHLFTDVNIAKSVSRWRTALVMREIEEEVEALAGFAPDQHALSHLMGQKAELEEQQAAMLLERQRARLGYGPQTERRESTLDSALEAMKAQVADLDAQIRPLAERAARLNHRNWGLLTRTGNDKSHLARQVERYADVYTSRVSNLLEPSPFAYFRSPQGSLPHDP